MDRNIPVPIYEYRCRPCGRRSSRLFKTLAAVEVPDCPHCGVDGLERLISRPTILGSGRGPSDDSGGMDDAALADLLPGLETGDPRSLARMTRHMSDEIGEDIPGEYEGVLRRMESGEMPSEEEMNAIEPDVGEEPSHDT